MSHILPAKKIPEKKFLAKLNKELCKKCGLCIHFCGRGVYVSGPGGYPAAAHPERCMGCRFCEHLCPDFALEVTESEESAGNPAAGK